MYHNLYFNVTNYSKFVMPYIYVFQDLICNLQLIHSNYCKQKIAWHNNNYVTITVLLVNAHLKLKYG